MAVVIVVVVFLCVLGAVGSFGADLILSGINYLYIPSPCGRFKVLPTSTLTGWYVCFLLFLGICFREEWWDGGTGRGGGGQEVLRG